VKQKKRKLRWIILLALLLFPLLYKYFHYLPKDYPLKQSITNIVSVTVRDGEDYNAETKEHRVIYELDAREGIELVGMIRSLDYGYNIYNPHLEIYRPYIEITYQDGATEKIGFHNNFYTTPDGKTHTRGYYIADSTFFDILSQYNRTDVTSMP